MKKATIRYVISSNIERLIRTTLGIQTEAGLATRSGIKQSTLHSILRGTIDVDVDTLAIIANALDVSPSALLRSSSTPADALSLYRDRIAALPADQQQKIQDFIDSLSTKHEEHAVN